jgi:hypothetical protein
MKKIFFILLAICLTGTACERYEPTINEIDGNENIEELDSNIILKMNETFTLPDDNDTMTVFFVDVREGRCPISTCSYCCFSSADVFLSITNSENTNVKIDLKIDGCILYPDSYTSGIAVDTLGYKFQLFKLLPYPDVDSIDKNDYIAKIKITKL